METEKTRLKKAVRHLMQASIILGEIGNDTEYWNRTLISVRDGTDVLGQRLMEIIMRKYPDTYK